MGVFFWLDISRDYIYTEVANGSGQSDLDYPVLNSSLPALAGMPFLGEVDHTPLPQELLQEFERILIIINYLITHMINFHLTKCNL